MNLTFKTKINIKFGTRFLVLKAQQPNVYQKFTRQTVSCESIKHHQGDKSIYSLESFSCLFYFTVALQ